MRAGRIEEVSWRRVGLSVGGVIVGLAVLLSIPVLGYVAKGFVTPAPFRLEESRPSPDGRWVLLVVEHDKPILATDDIWWELRLGRDGESIPHSRYLFGGDDVYPNARWITRDSILVVLTGYPPHVEELRPKHPIEVRTRDANGEERRFRFAFEVVPFDCEVAYP